MNTITVFSDHIRRVKQLAVVRTVIRMMFLTAGGFLCGYTVIALLERFVKVSFTDVVHVYGGLLLAAFLLAIIYAIVTRARLLDILIDIDTRLHLQDRLSTAYEYQLQGKSSDFLELLIEDAGQKLSHLTNNQMFPFKFSRLHLVILILIVLNLAMLGLDRVLPKELIAPPLDPVVSEQIQKTLEEYLMKNPESEKQKAGERNRQRQLRQELQQIARKLQEQAMTRKEMLEALQQNLKEIQSHQDRLTEELEANLKTLDNLRELPVRDMPRFERLSSSELKKLGKMMGALLDGELPEDIKENMALLQQYNNLGGMLEEILKDLERLTEDDPQVARGETGAGNSQEESGEGQQQENSHSGQGQASQLPSELEEEFGKGSRGQSIPGFDGKEEDELPTSSAPGNSIGDRERGPSSPIDRGQGNILQDRMAPSQKAEYTTHIRSVTKIGDTTVSEEEITRQYMHELESILQKEDIPLNYREYIKNYFLSIGIEGEK